MLAGYGLTSKVSSEAVTGVSVVQPAGQKQMQLIMLVRGEFNIAGALFISSVADGKAPIVAACAKSGIMVIYVQVLQLHI